MRDAVLTHNDGTVRQPGSDMVSEIAVYGGDDMHQVVRYAADAAEQVDGGFKAAGEESSTRQEEIADTGRGVIEG